MLARLLINAAILCACAEAEVHAAELLGRFRAEYPSAAAKLKTAYSHVRIHTFETWGRDADKFLWTCRCEYLREGDLIRKIQKIVQSSYPQMPDGTERALGGSSEKFFDIRKRPNQDRFGIARFGAMDRKDFYSQAMFECAPLFVSFCASSTDISEYLQRDDVHPASATTKYLDGEAAVIDVLLDQRLQDGHRFVHLYFLPDSWALAGWEITVGAVKNENDPRQVLVGRVKYADRDPLKLKSINRWQSISSDPQHKIDERLIIVESIEFGPIPHEQFTLAAFGVPEPVIPDTRTRLWWMMAINGPILLVLGIWFAVLAHRRRCRAACRLF